ncbi:MAG TPA: hypothetical protein VNY83_04960 [Solirubrobacterales bacterium]|nr:hypothetical protein [Solirubrobacterales bacterium]
MTPGQLAIANNEGTAIAQALGLDGFVDGAGNLTAMGHGGGRLWAPTQTYESLPQGRFFEVGGLAALASKRLTLCGGVVLPPGKTPQSISFISATGATNITHAFFALYNQALELLGVTVDNGATAWGANNRKTLAWSGPWTVPTAPLAAYVGIVVVAEVVPKLIAITSGSSIPGIGTDTPILCGPSTEGIEKPAEAPAKANALESALPAVYCTVKTTT